MHAYDTAGWTTYFEAMVGAAAALTGLLFVAVSFNLDKILAGPKFLPHRAAEALGTLVVVLASSALVLVPQSSRLLGVELLVLVVPLEFLVLRSLSAHRRGRTDDPLLWLISRAGATAICTVPALIGGISLALHWGGGLYWLVPMTLLGIGGAVYNAWVLLVEIAR